MAFYFLEESQTIDRLRREMDDLDRAQLMAYAVNKPDELDRRRKELRAKLRHDSASPPKKDFTLEEMDAAAKYMWSLTAPTKPMPS